jgi:TfoX/Sxy family transcriptional regulator of competence genes
MPKRPGRSSTAAKKRAKPKPKPKGRAKPRAARKMPAFSKPSAQTLALFADAISGSPDVQERTMFGYPAAFVNGNMMSSVFQDRIMVRLSEQDRAEAERQGGRPFEPMPGRPMKEYVELPPGLSAGQMRLWMSRALSYVRALPPKND